MNIAQRLITCEQCEKRKFNQNTGLVCSLTLSQPEFQNDCIDFEMDPKKFVQKMPALYNTKSNSVGLVRTLGIFALVIFVLRIFM